MQHREPRAGRGERVLDGGELVGFLGQERPRGGEAGHHVRSRHAVGEPGEFGDVATRLVGRLTAQCGGGLGQFGDGAGALEAIAFRGATFARTRPYAGSSSHSWPS